MKDWSLEIASEVAVKSGEIFAANSERDLALPAVIMLWKRHGEWIESAITDRLKEGDCSLDVKLLTMHRVFLRSELRRYVQKKIADKGKHYETGTDRPLRHGSMVNIGAYLSMLPYVHDAREKLLGSNEAIPADEAVTWLEKNEATPHAEVSLRPLGAIDNELRPITTDVAYITASDLASKGSVSLQAGDLLLSRQGGHGSFDPIVLEKPAIGTGQVSTVSDQLQETVLVISFKGVQTASLAEAATQIETLADGFLSAFWLILLGIWPGSKVEVLQREEAGKPPFSLEQEYLMYVALEIQVLCGMKTFTNRFYAEVLRRWRESVQVIEINFTGHPRFSFFKSERFSSVETVRRALGRIRKYLAKLDQTSGVTLPLSREEARDKEAMEGMRSSLIDLSWLKSSERDSSSEPPCEASEKHDS